MAVVYSRGNLRFGVREEAARPLFSELASHPVLQHGVPEPHTYVTSENFVICYDHRTRNPLWVMERLIKGLVWEKAADRGEMYFKNEPLVDKRFKNSGKLI